MAYPLIAHHFKNITAMQIDQPKTVQAVKRKLEQLEKVYDQYVKNSQLLGGYRIEVRFRCGSLSELVNYLPEGTFTLDWVRGEIRSSRNGGPVHPGDWEPLFFSVHDFLANIRADRKSVV